MPSKSIYVAAEYLSFLWLSSIPVCTCVCVCVCVCTPHILYLFICWWTLRLLLYLGNCTELEYCTILSCMYFFFELAFSFLWYIPKSGMAGSYGRLIFSLSEKSPNYFPQWLHQLTFSPTVCPQPHQHLWSVSFLTMAILTGVRYLILLGVVFVWIYLTTDDTEHLCIHLLAICIYMSSLEKCLFRTSVHF